jgi:hypothetical protein
MKGIVPIIGWVILGLALLLSFGADLYNTSLGGAIDLRNRITGVRLLAHDIDPYHYKWHEPDPQPYCDPYNNPNLPISKTTATPALLLLHLPVAVLPYRLGQFLWFLVQWSLLLGTGWLWLRRCETSRQRWLVALFLAGFTYTASWRLHAERGQAYVLLLFLFACWLTTTLDPKSGNRFWTGLLAGFLATLRPPFLLLAPFLAFHRRGQLPGVVAGLLLGIALPMFWQPNCWPDYFSAMQENSHIYRADFFQSIFDPHNAQAWPARIEDIPTVDILASYVPIAYADFSVYALLRWLGFHLEQVPVMLVLLAAVVPFGFWLYHSRDEPVEKLLPGLAAWFFLIDLFLPAFRDSYNDVLIINVLALALISSNRFPWAAWPCVAALPLGWAVYAFSPEQAWLINLPALFFTLGSILVVFLFNNRATARKL